MLQPPTRLRGMLDYGPEDVSLRDNVGARLRAFLARYGCQPIDTPLLEPTELLLRKSGGELASKMYTFTDPGGHRVSLRPEFTSSVVRSYLESEEQAVQPRRYAYLGPVFRYELEDGANLRQFTQIGAEVIGATGPWADAEVLAMACKGLAHVGVGGCILVIGHLGFTGALLESLGLSDRARLFLLSNLGLLAKGEEGMAQVQEKANALGLLRPGDDGHGLPAEPPNEAGMAMLERYLQNSTAAAIGVRTPQEIRERFLRKQALLHDAPHMEEAIVQMGRVAQVRGEPEEALRRTRAIVRAVEALEQLQGLEQMLEALSSYSLDCEIILDFGLGRGIAYYTGMVFEVRHPSLGGGSLGGGGRYDGLVQALGGAMPTPALGFAWTLENIIQVAGKQAAPSAPENSRVAAATQDVAGYAEAVREAERARAQDKHVTLDLSEAEGNPGSKPAKGAGPSERRRRA